MNTYRQFANYFSNITSKIYNDAKYETDVDEIIRKLEVCYQNSILEECIQNSSKVISPFIIGGYLYSKKELFPIYIVRDFISLMKTGSTIKRRIVLNNLWERLDQKERKVNPAHDDLPF